MLARILQQAQLRRSGLAALLMLGLYAVVQTFASSEALHQCLHEDSHAPDHHCVIQLIADGQMLAVAVPDWMPGVRVSFPPCPPPPAFAPVVVDLLLPPGRAPPVVPA